MFKTLCPKTQHIQAPMIHELPS
uniref:Uncharacterized protein n=1 Tax=Rhizophora mucronata TaxID=61149 RepID=A0A2P2NA25_RHIMU